MTAAQTSPKPSMPKLIHAAKILVPDEGYRYLFLRKKDDLHFVWFEEDASGKESETPVSALHVEEAIRLAGRQWKKVYFRPLNCGFRYTLPERDEHGLNALFYQMAASYTSSNGVYFDDDVGHNCFVQAASMESRELWQKLKAQNRL